MTRSKDIKWTQKLEHHRQAVQSKTSTACHLWSNMTVRKSTLAITVKSAAFIWIALGLLISNMRQKTLHYDSCSKMTPKQKWLVRVWSKGLKKLQIWVVTYHYCVRGWYREHRWICFVAFYNIFRCLLHKTKRNAAWGCGTIYMQDRRCKWCWSRFQSLPSGLWCTKMTLNHHRHSF